MGRLEERLSHTKAFGGDAQWTTSCRFHWHTARVADRIVWILGEFAELGAPKATRMRERERNKKEEEGEEGEEEEEEEEENVVTEKDAREKKSGATEKMNKRERGRGLET
jgi:hypothetical protein